MPDIVWRPSVSSRTTGSLLVAALLLIGCGEEPPRERETPPLEPRPSPIAGSAPPATPHALPNYQEKWRRLARSNPMEEASSEATLTLEWRDLMPADYRLESVLADYDVSGLGDTDYEAVGMLREIEAKLEQAPVVRELDGKRVRLPGYALPLEYAGERVTDLLLLPFYGACIHVPPPPLNQVVYVKSERGVEVRRLFDTLWVTGRLTAQRTDSEWGDAGYTLVAEGVSFMDGGP